MDIDISLKSISFEVSSVSVWNRDCWEVQCMTEAEVDDAFLDRDAVADLGAMVQEKLITRAIALYRIV